MLQKFKRKVIKDVRLDALSYKKETIKNKDLANDYLDQIDEFGSFKTSFSNMDHSPMY